MGVDSKLKILVVDDFASMRNLISGILQQIGFDQIIEAQDGEDAWRVLNEQEVGLVISDWNMPNMKGIDLLRKVRQSENHAGLPFIMVTAEGVKANVIEALQAGVSGYIVKPFSPAALKDKILKVFAKR